MPSFRDTRRLFTPAPAPLAPKAATPTAPASPTGAAKPVAGPAPPASSGVKRQPPIWLKHLAKDACDTPVITTKPLSAGRMLLSIGSQCRAGEVFHWRYGGLTGTANLDANGQLDLIIDCFAANDTPVELVFRDETRGAFPVEAGDIEHLSKVAIAWKAAADLDLHAFEYAAAAGSAGHVWSGAPSSPQAAGSRAAKDGRGSGFLARADDGRDGADRVEVYTFVHAAADRPGIVGFALQRKPSGATDNCTSGKPAEIAVRLSMMQRGAKPVWHDLIVADDGCAKAEAAATPDQTLLPALRLGRR